MGGAAPIEEYAALGDGRTVALVERGGSVDWLCAPNLDSPAVFARLLDRDRGGAFRVAPARPGEARRRYLPGTNVLETTHETPDGRVRVTDALTLPAAGLAPQRELVRLVEGVAGEVEVAVELEPRFGYGLERTRLEERSHAVVGSAGGDAVALVLPRGADVEVAGGVARARLRVAAGERLAVVLATAHGEPLVLPSPAEAEERLERTARAWSEWAETRDYEGPWREHVVRSALALKLLVFAPSGAIAAAPTTSLPERLGGDRNYDYRYCWVRDSSLTMSAFLELGCSREARAFLSWLMHASQLTRPELRVLYALDGGDEPGERELPLAGYARSRPVRVGNAASAQLQLDPYGDLLDAAAIFAADEPLDRDVGRHLAAVADHVCRIWRERDAGIWELRGRVDHFTEGKMKCAIALERACELARRGCLPRDRVDRWEREAAAIRRFVEEECWSDELRAYTRSPGSRELDASVLLAAQNRYSPEGDERLSTTIDALRERLGAGPLLYRADDLRDEEGAFVACSFWLVSALAHVGRVDEAGETMEAMLAHANDVGLFAEEIDPVTGAFLGNFPQGLSHLALVNAASGWGGPRRERLGRARRRARRHDRAHERDARRERAAADADGPPVPPRHGRHRRPRPREGGRLRGALRLRTPLLARLLGRVHGRRRGGLALRAPARRGARAFRRRRARQRPPAARAPADGRRLDRRDGVAARRAARVHAAELRPPHAARRDGGAPRLRRDRRRLRLARGVIDA
ncbi:MAG TPA: glycoside hydrolase family 15 protein [Gaiellaceae bacterium]|nr:glycoside hydrolase family 15 protein [Gaiellaceae bacterium]